MKVRGNLRPDPLKIEPCSFVSGQVEVRLREKVHEISVRDEMKDTEIVMYEYDEYVFFENDRPDLKKEIEANIEDWFATGRALELNQNASDYVDAQDENARLKAENDGITAQIADMYSAYNEGVMSA